MRWKPAGASFKATEPSFSDLREQADQQRRLNRGEPAIQGGSQGFGGGRGSRRAGNRAQGGKQDQGLYSDEMMVDAPPQNPRGPSRRHR